MVDCLGLRAKALSRRVSQRERWRGSGKSGREKCDSGGHVSRLRGRRCCAILRTLVCAKFAQGTSAGQHRAAHARVGQKRPPIPRVRPYAATTLQPSLFSRPQSPGVDRRRPLEQHSNRASLCKHKSPSSKRCAYRPSSSGRICWQRDGPSIQDPIEMGSSVWVK